VPWTFDLVIAAVTRSILSSLVLDAPPVELIEFLFEIAVCELVSHVLVSDSKGVFRCLLYPRGNLPPEGAEPFFA
jgi:hypothetical protein